MTGMFLWLYGMASVQVYQHARFALCKHAIACARVHVAYCNHTSFNAWVSHCSLLVDISYGINSKQGLDNSVLWKRCTPIAEVYIKNLKIRYYSDN